MEAPYDVHPENLVFLESLAEKPALKRAEKPESEDLSHKKYHIEEAIHTLRREGHLSSRSNPFGSEKPLRSEHTLEGLGFLSDEQDDLYPTLGVLEEEALPLKEILSHLHAVYCGRLGIEYEGFVDSDIAHWIQSRFEQLGGHVPADKAQKMAIYRLLSHAEQFETFLHTKYVGQKRFSLEGAETLIPMLAYFLDRCSHFGVIDVVVGMPHRGRLNVLANVLSKPLEQLLSEFEDQTVSAADAGDVKYHKGYVSVVETICGAKLPVTMISNPSHLESVDGVVEGFTRGLQTHHRDRTREKIVPILIHGDAALSGQGIVYETLQLSRLDGYTTGGTIHFIINNNIGFTTNPEDSRSTRYCTDIAKAFGFPIFHVNAEDPEACVWATISALELRQTFHIDVFVELNCYRKHGHNESDEPAFTQPKMYEQIRNKKTIRALYKNDLLHQGFTEEELSQHENKYKERLQLAFTKHKELAPQKEVVDKGSELESLKPLPEPQLRDLAYTLYTLPEGFKIHPRVKKIIDERRSVLVGGNSFALDWSFAEAIAFASLVHAGYFLRLAGQDSRRGTFSQRHAVWIDQGTNTAYFPLSAFGSSKCEVIDSPLSEYAALGFEYGFSLAMKKSLDLWEAQFGDFVNTAQVVIDQYIAAGGRKWGDRSNLTLLLPHGYEGQGPEHSSARIERFLALCADDNLLVSIPSTPAQYFHLLLHQATRRTPLIVFTPKGLLRYPECKSEFSELQGKFQEVLLHPSQEPPRRALIMTGRVYYDVLDAMKKNNDTKTALIRIEQLYPFPEKQLAKSLPQCKEYCFVQEEPENAGAYRWIKDQLQAILPQGATLHHVCRPASSTPAIGSHALHDEEHRELMRALFSDKDMV